MKINENLDLQEELANKDAALIDDSGKLKDNRNPIDRDTATNSPTKGMFETANELISEADYTPPHKKIAEKALKKLKKQSPLYDEQVDEVLNFQPSQPPEKDALVEAAEARKNRANAYDKHTPNSPEYAEARKLEDAALKKIGWQSMTLEDAERLINDYQTKVDRYNAIEVSRNEYMQHLRDVYTAQLNKIIEDDTKSWTERKKLMDKTGLLFGHVMQNIGATMHNIVNPNDWITASDPITLRMGQNLANTVKNRQTNNDAYIDSQVEYWKNVLPEYYDTSKIKQRLGNSRILNTYKRLDGSAQRIIMSLAASDAWDAVSDNAILVYMDKLQNGEFTSVPQMLIGLGMAALTSSGENKDKIFNKLVEFADGFGVDISGMKDAFKKVGDAASKVGSGVKAAGEGIGNAGSSIIGMMNHSKKEMEPSKSAIGADRRAKQLGSRK